MASATPFDLRRFVEAQDAHGTYDRAITELRAGRKVTHWMWFVFPQLAGLGRSATAQRFAIADIDEAQAYLAHDVLGARLLQCSAIVASHHKRSATDIFGNIDAQKLRSSMTLFLRADSSREVFAEVLQRFYSGSPDQATDALLKSPGRA